MEQLSKITEGADGFSIVLSGIDPEASKKLFMSSVQMALKDHMTLHILLNDSQSDITHISKFLPSANAVRNGNEYINAVPSSFDFKRIGQLQIILKNIGMNAADAAAISSFLNVIREIETLQRGGDDQYGLTFNIVKKYECAPNVMLLISYLDNLSDREKSLLTQKYARVSQAGYSFISALKAYSKGAKKYEEVPGEIYVYELDDLEANERDTIANNIIRSAGTSAVIFIDKGIGDKKCVETLAASSDRFTYISDNVFDLDPNIFKGIKACTDIMLFSRQTTETATECERFFGSFYLPKTSHTVHIDRSDDNVFHKLFENNRTVSTERHTESVPRYSSTVFTKMPPGCCIYSSRIGTKSFGKIKV